MFLSFVLVLATMFSGCSKDYSKITTTRVRPPVSESLPGKLLVDTTFASLTGSSNLLETDYSKNCQTDNIRDYCTDYSGEKRILCIVKNRLFCTGPTEVLTLLDSLDARLVEIENRSSEGDVSCLSDAAVDLSSDLSFPGSVTMTHKLQCVDSSIGLGFGQDGGTWYVRQGANGAGSSLFSVTADPIVNGYYWLVSADKSYSNSTGMLNIKANRSTGLVEITGGGVGLGFCSFHFISDANYIYVQANPDGASYTCDYDGSGITNSNDWVEICIDASTMDVTTSSSCSSLSASRTLTTLGRAATSSWEVTATPASGTIQTFDLGDYLNDLHAAAGVMTGVSEFKTEGSSSPF